MISTVVFDLDDTLYDEVDYCRSGFRVVSEFISNYPGAPESGEIFSSLLNHFRHGNRRKLFDFALEELGVVYEPETIAKLVKVYRNHIPILSLPSESADVLKQLKVEYRLALLTDGFLPAQRYKVQSLGLEDYFEYIVYTEELGREFWKPSPAGFHKILRHFGVVPEETVFVADNIEKDFIAPNDLGFKTVQVLRPRRIRKEEVAGVSAHYTIGSLNQLPELLKGV